MDLLKMAEVQKQGGKMIFSCIKNIAKSVIRKAIMCICKENQFKLLKLLLTINVRQGVWIDASNQAFFFKMEKFGFHVLPVHFYSPVPDTGALVDSVWDCSDASNMHYEDEKMLSLLSELSKYKKEVMDIPEEKSDVLEYFYNNLAFNGMDAIMYYYMIRHFKPSKLVEVGSGYSTLIAAKAVLKNASENVSTEFTAIEPYPAEFLRECIPGLCKLVPDIIQNIPLSFFEALEPGDILFIDSTHVSKIGSDVNYIFLRILPILKHGVIIHFHDIFLPCEFPKDWVKKLSIFWNEQYLLQTLLIANGEYYTLMPNYYIGSNYEDEVKSYMPRLAYYTGGSYWILKGKR